jgi:hypothetical protein
MNSERRQHDRREADPTRFGERGMRCDGCGTVWYSAVASTVVGWGRCIQCGGALHIERRSGERRRATAYAAA